MQDRPNSAELLATVAAYLEDEGMMLYLVLKNFGSTTAREVVVRSNQTMTRAIYSEGDGRDIVLPERLPAMVPGQTWRTLFDYGPTRMDAEQDDVYELTISSRDSRGKRLEDEKFLIDWHTFMGIEGIEHKTVHDIGRAVEGIQKTLSSWTEGIGGLSVVSRDGHKKDAERAERRASRSMTSEEALKRLRPNGPSGSKEKPS